MPHDVLADVIRRIVAAGRLALPLVIFEVDLALVDDRQRLLYLPGGFVDFFALFLRDGELLSSDAELELQQPFVDAAQMPHAERFEIDEHERLGAVIYVASQTIEAEGEITIRIGIDGEELTTVCLRGEQTTIVGRHVELIGAMIDDSEQRLQP